MGLRVCEVPKTKGSSELPVRSRKGFRLVC